MLRRGRQKPASSDKGNTESGTAMTTPSNNNQLNALTAEIEQRTGGKLLGEMTNEGGVRGWTGPFSRWRSGQRMSDHFVIPTYR